MDDEGSSTIDIAIEAPVWAEALPEADRLCHEAIAATFEAARVPAWVAGARLGIILADDAALCALNAQWRGKDRPTNVLSFPAHALDPEALPERPPFAGMPLGDLALAFETIVREAAAEGKPLAHHVTHLIVHGALHLLGHDHEEAAAATRMERLEAQILARLGIPDPYADDLAEPVLEASS